MDGADHNFSLGVNILLILHGQLKDHIIYGHLSLVHQPFDHLLQSFKIRLFDLRSNKIYIGLVSYIKEFCDDREYTYEYEESEDEFQRRFEPSVSVGPEVPKVPEYDQSYERALKEESLQAEKSRHNWGKSYAD